MTSFAAVLVSERQRLGRVADVLAALLAAVLPWSTSAAGILAVLLVLVLLPAFAEAYAQPHAAGTPVTGLVEMLDELGARSYAEARAQGAMARARQALAATCAQAPAGQALVELTDQLLNRQR